MAWDADAAARSCKLAESELHEMLGKMTPEQREGAQKIFDWWKLWYNRRDGQEHATGHRALGRMLIKH